MIEYKNFNENLYDSLNMIFGDEGKFDVSTLNVKSNDYGEDLVAAMHKRGLMYMHNKRGGDEKIDAVSYINDIELIDNHIIVRTTYWTKYGQLCVKKNGCVTGWNKRNTSHGYQIIFDIDINGDEFNSVIIVKISTNGPLGSIVIKLSDGYACYITDKGRLINCYKWNNPGKEALSIETGISNMMHECIENTINWIMENIIQVSFEMTGYTQME